MQNFEKSGLTVQALGPEELDGKKVEGIAVSDPARKAVVRLYLDAANKLVVKKVFTASLMGPPAETEEIYSDYREVEGMKVPFKTLVSQSGKKRAEQTVTDMKINPGLAESAYKKP
jgi:hypothetical protein